MPDWLSPLEIFKDEGEFWPPYTLMLKSPCVVGMSLMILVSSIHACPHFPMFLSCNFTSVWDMLQRYFESFAW